MKRVQIILFILLMMPVLFFSCSKETDDNIDQQEKFYTDNPDAIAQVRFINAYTALTINGLSTSLATSGTGFRITMDGNKINAAQNNSSATNTFRYGGQPDTVTYPLSFYPSATAAPTTPYAFLNPGQHNFRFIMNRIVSSNFAPTAADEVFNATVGLTAGKKYSMFIADPYAPPGVYMVEDNFIVPEPNAYGVRFINLSGDATSRYDVVSRRYGGKLFSDVGNKELRNFMYIGTTTRDTISLMLAGTNTLVSSISFLPGTQRVYTWYARGKTGVAGRTPAINYYTNR